MTLLKSFPVPRAVINKALILCGVIYSHHFSDDKKKEPTYPSQRWEKRVRERIRKQPAISLVYLCQTNTQITHQRVNVYLTDRVNSYYNTRHCMQSGHTISKEH